MVYSYKYMDVAADGQPVEVGVTIGQADRPLVACPQSHPTMQNIIDSVRNTVDAQGNPIFQPVVVPVRNLPTDLQAILEQGGALDWVNRSIDQVIFTHNISIDVARDGVPLATRFADGLAPSMDTLHDAFDSQRTIIVNVPKGTPQTWRTAQPDLASSFATSVTPTDIAETASVIVHETQHTVDNFNTSRNTPHDFPLREKRFYDRMLANEGAFKNYDHESRAVGAQDLFAQEVAQSGAPHFTELADTPETWREISNRLQTLQTDMDAYAKVFKDGLNPLKKLATKTRGLAGSIQDKLRDHWKDFGARHSETEPHYSADGYLVPTEPAVTSAHQLNPPSEFDLWRELRGDSSRSPAALGGAAGSPIAHSIGGAKIEPPSLGFGR